MIGSRGEGALLSDGEFPVAAGGREVDTDSHNDLALLSSARKLNLTIVEIAIRYHERTYGETNIRWFSHGRLSLRMAVRATRRMLFVT